MLKRGRYIWMKLTPTLSSVSKNLHKSKSTGRVCWNKSVPGTSQWPKKLTFSVMLSMWQSSWTDYMPKIAAARCVNSQTGRRNHDNGATGNCRKRYLTESEEHFEGRTLCRHGKRTLDQDSRGCCNLTYSRSRQARHTKKNYKDNARVGSCPLAAAVQTQTSKGGEAQACLFRLGADWVEA